MLSFSSTNSPSINIFTHINIYIYVNKWISKHVYIYTHTPFFHLCSLCFESVHSEGWSSLFGEAQSAVISASSYGVKVNSDTLQSNWKSVLEESQTTHMAAFVGFVVERRESIFTCCWSHSMQERETVFIPFTKSTGKWEKPFPTIRDGRRSAQIKEARRTESCSRGNGLPSCLRWSPAGVMPTSTAQRQGWTFSSWSCCSPATVLSATIKAMHLSPSAQTQCKCKQQVDLSRGVKWCQHRVPLNPFIL